VEEMQSLLILIIKRNVLINNHIISGNYSKTPFLMRFAALFTEIMLRASTRQGLLFRRYKRKSNQERQR